MTKKTALALATAETGMPLVPDPRVADEFEVSLMAIWRWDHDPELIALGWPPPIVIRKRKYRPRPQLEVFKKNLMDKAIRDRRRHRSHDDARR